MLEHETRGMQERSLKALHRTNISGHASVNASVQRVADDRMPDSAQVNADLMRPARMDRYLAECQSRQRVRARDPGDCFACVFRAC